MPIKPGDDITALMNVKPTDIKPGDDITHLMGSASTEPGNIDLYKQPTVPNPEGGESTVYSRSYNLGGKETLLPSVTPDGRFLKTDQEVLDEYKKTGRHLGKFDTVEEANKYAEQLHNDYAAGKYKPKQKEESGLIESAVEGVKGFLAEHPQVRAHAQRFFSGHSDEDLEYFKQKGIHVMSGPDIQEIPGVSAVTHKISSMIDPEDKPFYTGLRPFAAGLTEFIGGTLAGGFDPRTAGARVPKLSAIADMPKAEADIVLPQIAKVAETKQGQLPLIHEVQDVIRKDKQQGSLQFPREEPVVPVELPTPAQVKPGDDVTHLITAKDKLSKKLQEAVPLNVEQKAIYRAEKADKFAKAKGVNITDEASANQFMRQLAGPHTKVQFEPPNLEQPDVDQLMKTIGDYKGDVTDKINAVTGLKKVLEGNVPQPSEVTIMKKVFGGNDPGDAFHSSIDSAVTNLAQHNLPKPGQAEVPNMYSSNFNSPNKTLARYKTTEPISKEIVAAMDKKLIWQRSVNNRLVETTKGLGKSERTELWKAVQGAPSPNPVINSRAQVIKDIIEKEYGFIPGPNFLKEFTTNMEGQPKDIKAAVDSIFKFHGMTANETDPNKILPALTDAISRVKFDKPAIMRASGYLEGLPDGVLKEMATAYIKNYSRFDAEPELHKAWANFSNKIANTSARSFISLNPGVHMLHVGQIPANIWPELGTKYTFLGFSDFVRSPYSNFKNMANLGLLRSEIKPFRFRTKLEKLDSITYGLSTIESMVKGTAFNGFKRKFLAEGMDEAQATMRALDEAKNATMTVDPARQMKGFTSESNFIGGSFGARDTMQFKQIPMKIVEQYVDIIKDFKQNPAKANRALWGGATAFGGTMAGLHTFHVDPISMLRTAAFGGLGDTLLKVLTSLKNGNLANALYDTAAYLTPGGAQIKKVLSSDESGPKELKFVD